MMIWTDYEAQGAICGENETYASNVLIDRKRWDVYFFDYGSNNNGRPRTVFSFLARNKSNDFSGNLKEFVKHAINQGWVE